MEKYNLYTKDILIHIINKCIVIFKIKYINKNYIQFYNKK